MAIEKKNFGILSTGEEVSLYVLRAGEYRATWCDYGATWLSLVMPDKHGVYDDVLLGFSSFAPYVGDDPYFGATVGRFANRIAKAKFPLEGKVYALFANNGQNHLHGGRRGFSKRLWDSESDSNGSAPLLRFSRRSADGEEGYPGNLDVSVTVSLDPNGRLSIEYEAATDRITPLNLTNHAYFNLAGEGMGTILAHELAMKCSRYLPVDDSLIPLPGAPVSVHNTPFDFREPKLIGKDIHDSFSGYDHCFVIDKAPYSHEPFATVKEATSGRRLAVSTSMPAVQFYTGNFLNGIIGKRGSIYGKHSGFCLETQFFPDSPNRSDYPSSLAEPGKTWKHSTDYIFSLI